MFRPASSRALLRAPTSRSIRVVQPRRLASTAAPPPEQQKSRSWKNTLLRLGLAVGAVYYYNTSSVFAEEPAFSLRPQPEEDESNLPTLDSISSKIRQRQQQREQQQQQRQQQQPTDAAQSVVAVSAGTATEERPEGPSSSPQDLEEQADQEGAFNPETGEINWDCPCLGGMAHGPCGEEFKAAFSCFVFSKEEPKGMDCIDKFKTMQECFRRYPDVYGTELEDDEADEQLDEPIASSTTGDNQRPQVDVASSTPEEKQAAAKQVRAQATAEAAQQGEQPESEALVPKAALDAQQRIETKATKAEK
ncbi:intermembrane space protein [Thermoascus aurantiacus ATCC 26904]